mmetsp:Transcript_32241/g.113495  ORF Transcript_32241/g.113495 Transcript_32241/m.113495 type:complete len:294 (-) Transcript_32241:140-1021(-)
MRRVERRPRVARARRGRVDERDCPRRHLGRLVHQPQARKRPLRQLRLQRPRRRPQRRVVVVRVVLDGPERAFALRPGGALQRQALALLRLDHRRQQQRRHVDRGAPDGVRVQRGRGQSGAEDCALERQDAADVRRRAGARRVGPRGGVDEHEDERRQRRRVRGRRPEHAPRAAACARLEAVRRLAARPQQVEHVLVEGPRVVVLLVLVDDGVLHLGRRGRGHHLAHAVAVVVVDVRHLQAVVLVVVVVVLLRVLEVVHPARLPQAHEEEDDDHEDAAEPRKLLLLRRGLDDGL